MEFIGLLIFSALFIYNGFNHIRNHEALSGYAASAFGKSSFAQPLGYIGGWPTGVFLIACGAGTVWNASGLFAYSLAAFLMVTGVLFHSNLKDPANMKHWALLGAALFIASQV